MKKIAIKIIEEIINYSELFFFIGLGIGLFSLSWLKWDSHFDQIIINFEPIRYAIAFVFIGLRLFSLFFINSNYAFKSYFILLIFTISSYFCQSFYLLQTAVFIVGCYKIDFKKIITVVLISSLITFGFDIVGSLSKHIDLFLIQGGRFRFYFGFKHPSYFSIHFFTSISIIWYLHLKNKLLLTTILFFIVGIFLWAVPNTRGTAISSFVFPLILVFCIITFNYQNKKRLTVLYCFIPLALLALSIFMTFFGQNMELTRTISIRFHQAYAYYQMSGIHLFKSSLMWLDNQYMFLLEHFGVVVTSIYFAFYFGIIKKSISNNNPYILALLITLLIYGLIDNYSLNPRFNISLFYLYSKYNDTQFTNL